MSLAEPSAIPLSSSAAEPTIGFVVMTEEQARQLPGESQRPVRVVALTPQARRAAAAFPCNVDAARYGTAEQAQLLEMIARLELACESAERSHPLPTAVATTVKNLLIIFASTTIRLKCNIGPGPWAIWTGEDWRICADADEAADYLAMTAPWEPPFTNPPSIGLPSLVSGISKAVAKLLCRRPAVLFESLDRGFGPLASKVAASPEHPLCVELIVGRSVWRCARHLMLAAIAPRRGIVRLPVPVRRDHRWDGTVRAYVAEVLPWAPSGLADRVADAAALTAALSSDMGDIIRALKPAVHLSFQMRWMKGAAVAQACGEAGVKRVLVSHGSHPLPADERSAIMLRVIADGLLTSPLADEFWLQSPHAEKSLEWLSPGRKAAGRRIQPLVWGYRGPPERPPGVKRLRILHAGTYKPIIGHRPWMYETADDYVRSVGTLAAAVAGDPRFELVIRPRLGPECDEATLRAELPAAANVVVDGTGPFLDVLARTDLLVSDSSTTIEEALAARIPVLQWSSRGHYFHLPPRFAPPSGEDRAAVYGVVEAAGLVPMLSAILAAHAGHPLTDTELTGHLWPTGTPDMDALAAELAARARASRT